MTTKEPMPERIWAYKTCGAVYTSVANADHIKCFPLNAEYIRSDLIIPAPDKIVIDRASLPENFTQGGIAGCTQSDIYKVAALIAAQVKDEPR